MVGHHQRYGRGSARPAASSRGDLVGVAARRPASRRARRRAPGRRSAAPTPAALTSTPIAVSSCSAMPRTWRAADDGGEADDRRRRGARAPRGRRGTPRMVPTETTGLDGGSSDQVGVGDRVDARPGPGVDVLEPDDDHGLGRAPRRAAAPSTPGSARPGARSGRRGRRSRRGSRPGRRSSAAGVRVADVGLPAPAQRLGDLRRAGSRRRASGCGPGGWRCRGRRGRTRSAPRRTPPARPWRSTSRRAGPSRARRRCRRRGCTSRCRGRGRP